MHRSLSARERQIIDLLAQGWTGVEISRRLFLAPETVRQAIGDVTRKLGARNRTHAVAIVVSARMRA